VTLATATPCRQASAYQHQHNRTTYLRWALHSFEDQCLVQAQSIEQAWFVPKMPVLGCAVDLPEMAAAWLAGMTQAAIKSHPHLFDGQPGSPGFVSAWGSLSPDRRPLRLSEGELLFNRWVSLPLDQWDEFYLLSLQALRSLKGVAFDLSSLYDIAHLRSAALAADDHSWDNQCFACFIRAQPQSES
jgi:hypothetical protein